MVAHPHLVRLLLSIEVINHLIVVLVIIVNAGTSWVIITIIARILLSYIHTIVTLVVAVAIQIVVLVSIYLI